MIFYLIVCAAQNKRRYAKKKEKYSSISRRYPDSSLDAKNGVNTLNYNGKEAKILVFFGEDRTQTNRRFFGYSFSYPKIFGECWRFGES